MDSWPFAYPPDTGVFTTQPVLDGAPIKDVHHDQDGDWQILCGTTLDEEDAASCTSRTSWTCIRR